MKTYLEKGFYAKRASCNVRYKKSFIKNEMNEDDVQLYNLEKDLIYCKNDVDYIKSFIEYIKEKVIKNCKTLDSVKITLSTFDKNNMIHTFMVAIITMMKNLLQIKEKVNMYKSIFVIIEYEGRIVFTGNLNFTGLD